MSETNTVADIFLTADERRVILGMLAVDAHTSVLAILQSHETLVAKSGKIVAQMSFIGVTNYQVASVPVQGGKVSLTGVQRLYLSKLLDEDGTPLGVEIRALLPRCRDGLQMKLNDSMEDGFSFSRSSGRGENPS